MIVAESRHVRRLVGRFDKGADVLEQLVELCRAQHVRTAEVRAIGSLEQVVLSEYDQRNRVQRAPRRFDSPFELVQLSANVSELNGKPSVQARVVLSRERDNGIELLGGQLLSGRVFAVEFVLDAFDDVLLRRVPDQATGLALWREAIGLGEPDPADVGQKPSPPPFEAPPRTQWKDVIAASEARPEPEPVRAPAVAVAERAPALEPVRPPASTEEVRAVPGDWIEHPKFGRCQVERVEGDYEFISARLRNQRLIRLSLDVLTLVPVGKEGEHQLFRAEPGR